jgi:hypothetical protein
MKKVVFACATMMMASSLMAADGVSELKAEISRLKAQYEAEKKPLGIADEAGVYVLTEEGKKLESLEAKLRKLNGEPPAKATRAALMAGWGLKPLGAPGTLKLPTEFRNQPTLGKMPKRAPGLKIFGGGVKARIIVETKNKSVRALADEFAWHLAQMTGSDFTVEIGTSADAKGAAVVFRYEDGDRERAHVWREGNVLFIGGTGSGVSHATTYVLEALGCRYVWPGESGKVIPKRREVVLPEIALDMKPALKIRGVRDYGTGAPGSRWYVSLTDCGFVPEEFAKRRAAAHTDHKGNRGFWRWHGVNDTKSVLGYCLDEANYRWGHYYGDYVQKYAKTHPEWFALQPDGTRTKAKMSRPTFCQSHAALSEETAKNLIASFKANPHYLALSACLPDGGYFSPCMCEACRRLDPANAPARKIQFFTPYRRYDDYVSLTDRTFDFFNRLAAGVVAEMPGKKVCVYAYSDYCQPPVKTIPHPSLVILSVAGNYVNPDTRNSARQNLAAWSQFGNELLWRPNALAGYRTTVIQNFSRSIFEDMELFKVNGLVGTDFDCMDDSWSTKGLVYYMLARSFLNPDHLDYDTIYADYLDATFGPAAGAMRDWFDSLASDMGMPDYVAKLDLAKYESILARAETAAAGQTEILRRLKIMRTGLGYTSWRQKEANCSLKDKAAAYAIQKGFYDFIHEVSATPDGLVAVNPTPIGFLDHFLKPYLVLMKKDK